MAAYVAAKRIRQLGFHSHHQYHHHYHDQFPTFCKRKISQLVETKNKRLFLVDTLAIVKRLEVQGVSTKQAETITSSIIEVLNGSLDNVVQSFVAEGEMQKIDMTHDSNLSNFESQIQSSQNNHFGLLQHETEKLTVDMDKMRSELRYEIDKVIADQSLELNLEKGRIHDDLTNKRRETARLTNKLDKELYGLRAQVEASKYEVMRYCVGTLASISAIGLAILRIFTS